MIRAETVNGGRTGSWGGEESLRESGLRTAALSTAQGEKVGSLLLKDYFKKKKKIRKKLQRRKHAHTRKIPKFSLSLDLK